MLEIIFPFLNKYYVLLVVCIIVLKYYVDRYNRRRKGL